MPVLVQWYLFQPLLTETLPAKVICVKGFPVWIFVAGRQGQVLTFYRQEHGRVSAHQPVFITIPYLQWKVHIHPTTCLGLNSLALCGQQTLEWGHTHQPALIDPDPLLKVRSQVTLLQQDFICSSGTVQTQAVLGVVKHECLHPWSWCTITGWESLTRKTFVI